MRRCHVSVNGMSWRAVILVIAALPTKVQWAVWTHGVVARAFQLVHFLRTPWARFHSARICHERTPPRVPLWIIFDHFLKLLTRVAIMIRHRCFRFWLYAPQTVTHQTRITRPLLLPFCAVHLHTIRRRTRPVQLARFGIPHKVIINADIPQILNGHRGRHATLLVARVLSHVCEYSLQITQSNHFTTAISHTS